MAAVRMRYFSGGLYVACIILIGFHYFKEPSYNWDFIPYTALVLQMDGHDSKDAHASAYRLAKETLSPERYRQLTDSSNSYRNAMVKDPSAFNSQLQFYAVKPLYITLCYLSYKSGVHLPHATLVPSFIAYLLTGLLLFYWLSLYLRLWVVLISSLLLMLSPPLIEGATLSTPDLLSAFFLLSSFYFIIQKPSLLFAFLAMILSVLARVDNILICFLVLFTVFASRRWYRRISFLHFAFMSLILAVCYIGITLWARQYGGSIFFYNDLAAQFNPSNTPRAGFSLQNYFIVMGEHLKIGITSSHLALFMSLLVVTLAKDFSLRKLSFDQLFCLLITVSLLARFILLPTIADRFYIAFYLVIFILLVRAYSPTERRSIKE
jgi:hypothetical protein